MHELLNTKFQISNEAVNAAYDYSASEIDLFIKIIAAVSREKDTNKRAHLIMSYSQLTSNPLESHSNYDELRRAFRGLLSKPMEIYYNETQRYFMANLISAVDIQRRNSIIKIDIHPQMVAIICDIRQRYTTLQMASVLALRGKYSKRMYMLACQFINTGVRYCTYSELRKLFKVGDKYDDVSDFKKRVLDPAIKEVSAVTEIEVFYNGQRNGRKLENFILEVKMNATAVPVAGLEKQVLFMQNCGLAQWQIDNVTATLAPDELHKTLYDFNLIKQGVKNKGAYLARTFENLGVPMTKKISSQLDLIDQIKYNEQKN